MDSAEEKRVFVHKNGVEVPAIALGTALNKNDEEVQQTILDALDIGYRAIDTSEAYFNQESIGKALDQCGYERHELYITSKVWNSHHGYDKTMYAFDKTLDELKLTYVDQYLIHWPGQAESFLDTWRALERIYKENRARVIGVSNFLVHHLTRLMDEARILPMVDQLELNPAFVPTDVVVFCKENGIQLEATRPICKGALDGYEILDRLAQKYGKTKYQIVLRWHIDQGIRPLPKSVHKERMEENFDIFDFQLLPDEISEISKLNTHVRQTGQDPDEYFEISCDFDGQ